MGDLAPSYLPSDPSHVEPPLTTMGGVPMLLFFLGSASNPQIRPVLEGFYGLQAQLRQHNVHFLGISIDPEDYPPAPPISLSPLFRFLWDLDGDISIRYGVCREDGRSGDITYEPTTFVLDENSRVKAIFPLDAAVDHVQQVMNFVKRLPVPTLPKLVTQQAPVLLIPNVCDRSFCDQLIRLYEADGGRDSGFMQQVGTKTLEVLDPNVKQRRDFLIQDHGLIGQINQVIWQRIKPEIEKAFQFQITRFERYLVACYEANNQGFFGAHRDNVTTATAHRRFAMTLNLNTGEYEGGYLRFPEYGSQLYRPEVGEAVIFSCSLLHEATPVTQGRRFTLLSFFHNDDDQQKRLDNLQHVVPRVADE